MNHMVGTLHNCSVPDKVWIKLMDPVLCTYVDGCKVCCEEVCLVFMIQQVLFRPLLSSIPVSYSLLCNIKSSLKEYIMSC